MSAPKARCAAEPSHRPLVFSQPNPYGSQWECSCLDCADGEPDGETGHMMRLDKAGWGKTPEEALDNYAEQFEMTVEELLVKDEPEPVSERSPEDTYMGQYYNGQRNWREEEGS